MHRRYCGMGEHLFEVNADSAILMSMFTKQFYCSKIPSEKFIDAVVFIHAGYETSLARDSLSEADEQNVITICHGDCLIYADSDYQSAHFYVYNQKALRRAFYTFYSYFIVHREGGLIFCGTYDSETGAVSIVPDDAANGITKHVVLVKILSKYSSVYIMAAHNDGTAWQPASLPVSQILILQPYFEHERVRLGKSTAVIQLINRIYGCPDEMELMRNIITLLKKMVAHISTYNSPFGDCSWVRDQIF